MGEQPGSDTSHPENRDWEGGVRLQPVRWTEQTVNSQFARMNPTTAASPSSAHLPTWEHMAAAPVASLLHQLAAAAPLPIHWPRARGCTGSITPQSAGPPPTTCALWPYLQQQQCDEKKCIWTIKITRSVAGCWKIGLTARGWVTGGAESHHSVRLILWVGGPHQSHEL